MAFDSSDYVIYDCSIPVAKYVIKNLGVVVVIYHMNVLRCWVFIYLYFIIVVILGYYYFFVQDGDRTHKQNKAKLLPTELL